MKNDSQFGPHGLMWRCDGGLIKISWSLSLKLVNMIQAIRDLANAFVPSGKLIDLVDITLVSLALSLCLCLFFLLPQIALWHHVLWCFAASDGWHSPKPFWWGNQRNCSCFRSSSRWENTNVLKLSNFSNFRTKNAPLTSTF